MSDRCVKAISYPIRRSLITPEKYDRNTHIEKYSYLGVIFNYTACSHRYMLPSCFGEREDTHE